MAMYTVKQGETLQSIAIDARLADWKLIYDAPENAAFKSACERGDRDPYILYPDESIFVPNREMKHEPAAVDQTHSFRMPPVAGTKLRIVLESPEGIPITNEAWTLSVDGETFTGNTGSTGVIEADIPVKVKSASLTVHDVTWQLQVGNLNPLDGGVADHGVSGAQARLKNLGFPITAIDGQLNEETVAALKAFQSVMELTESGELNDDTRKALAKVYGC